MKRYVVIVQYVDESLEQKAYLIETEEEDITQFCDAQTCGFMSFSTREEAVDFMGSINDGYKDIL